MFTGIIEDKGKVLRVEYRGQEKRLTVELPLYLTEVQLGDSININGVCLTIVQNREDHSTRPVPRDSSKDCIGELKEGIRSIWKEP
jgi:riboflavin synthase